MKFFALQSAFQYAPEPRLLCLDANNTVLHWLTIQPILRQANMATSTPLHCEMMQLLLENSLTEVYTQFCTLHPQPNNDMTTVI